MDNRRHCQPQLVVTKWARPSFNSRHLQNQAICSLFISYVMYAVEKLIENLYCLINIFMYNDNLRFKNVNRPGNSKILTISGPPLKCRDGCSFPIEINLYMTNNKLVQQAGDTTS